jgi:GNAT superfamily N-acetyltransferase
MSQVMGTSMTEAAIERLTAASPDAVEQIAVLLPQLTPRAEGIDMDRLKQVIATPGGVYVARIEGKIVGIIQRVDVHHVVRTKSWIEDFVVDEAFRGQGIATSLLQAAIDDVPAESTSINLTSSASRTSSHKVYAKFGFALRENATVWRLNLA